MVPLSRAGSARCQNAPRCEGPAPGTAPTVDIVVPVRDEERILAFSVRRLAAYLRDDFPYTARITIAENGSSDATWEIAQALAAELERVRAIRVGAAGR